MGSKTSFGPVGTVALRGILQLDTTGAFEGTVAGDGAVASVAARFGLSVFNVNPGRFGALNAFGYEVGRGDAVVDGYGAFGAISGLSRPPVAGASPSWGVFGHLGASYRLNRRTVLELDPSLLYVRGGVGVGLQGAVQVRRLRGRDDGAVRVATLLDAGAEAGLSGSYGAAGFEYRYNPPTGPLLARFAVAGGRESRGGAGGREWRACKTTLMLRCVTAWRSPPNPTGRTRPPIASRRPCKAPQVRELLTCASWARRAHPRPIPRLVLSFMLFMMCLFKPTF